MRDTSELSPSPTDLIDWMNDEGLLELDWDFPEDGNLYDAGLCQTALGDLVAAVENEYDIELTVGEFKSREITSPAVLARVIAEKSAG